jgi:hypothetical protein
VSLALLPLLSFWTHLFRKADDPHLHRCLARLLQSLRCQFVLPPLPFRLTHEAKTLIHHSVPSFRPILPSTQPSTTQVPPPKPCSSTTRRSSSPKGRHTTIFRSSLISISLRGFFLTPQPSFLPGPSDAQSHALAFTTNRDETMRCERKS